MRGKRVKFLKKYSMKAGPKLTLFFMKKGEDFNKVPVFKRLKEYWRKFKSLPEVE